MPKELPYFQFGKKHEFVVYLVPAKGAFRSSVRSGIYYDGEKYTLYNTMKSKQMHIYVAKTSPMDIFASTNKFAQVELVPEWYVRQLVEMLNSENID